MSVLGLAGAARKEAEMPPRAPAISYHRYMAYRLYNRLRARCRQQGGFTLIEMLVTMLIMGILLGASVSVIISVFNSNITSFQVFNQETTLQQASGFLYSRLSDSSGGGVVLGTTAGAPINQFSIAGDQLVFLSGATPGQRYCYRVYYVQSAEQVRLASTHVSDSAASCTSTSIDPSQGPNTAGSSPTDTVLNGTVSSMVLASNVEAAAPAGTPTPTPGYGSPLSNPLPMFTYYTVAGGDPISNSGCPSACTNAGPDPSAGQSDTSSWYGTAPFPTPITEVVLTLYVGTGVTSGASAKSRYFQELIPVG